MAVPAPKIVTCSQWGASPARRRPTLAPRPGRIIFHHTAGHGPKNHGADHTALDLAKAYARAIQHQHMQVNGWDDSGHSFLVMRSGIILQGRWGTVTAVEHGRMVVSAHCPGQNDQPGIEHEHLGAELLTAEQHAASVHLLAWIADRCTISPTEIYAHNTFYNTACPGNLAVAIPRIRADVAAELTLSHRGGPKRSLLPLRALLGRG